MNDTERRQKIESYGSAHADLVEALSHFPQEMWHYTSADDPWSIHDIVVHITDSEANSYVRCRRCVAEPGQAVMAYNEEVWATVLDYGAQDAGEALVLFKWLRLRTYRLIKTLPNETWVHTIDHPENGTMTLEDWFEVYVQHVPEHSQQMQRIYEAWQREEAG